MPPDWGAVTVEAQLDDEHSMLSLYRYALELRRELPDLTSPLFGWQGAPDGCLAYRRGAETVVAINMGDAAAPMPPGEVLLASGPVDAAQLPANTAVWLRV